MLGFIKKLFGIGSSVNYAQLVNDGAQIIDVRTTGEFASGHIKGSINIPLQTLSANLKRIKKDKPVVTCCASGMRSASARGILKSNGYENVYNGGGWTSLNSKMNG